ncbi:hypothetical protein KB879_01320 [Cupriavidus sp. KK10]|jgi:hypothetical protein|uniref:hypothetical protein n=1 Tax=Cupriavidus sp. KK10 TaxID=1478019 RepID=UPI001BAA7C60|nr:hypothetical protein [Cupriavidus sp. KK10]QUN28646.1 hypothetical protein KB879_01320 [Cupriavidus sp. KK10]
MAKNRCASLLVTLAAVVWTPLVFSAPPAKDAAHEKHHAPERPESPAAAPQGNPDLDAQIAHLRAIRERLSRANTPEERQALMAERAKVMQEAMATVHKASGMPGRAGMRPPTGTSKVRTAQAGMCNEMTEQHVALMQEMMQAMTDYQGMGGGMGPGMAQPMGGGMMRK